MKKLITLALIIGATTFTQGQSNLVFNRVINFNLDFGEETTVPEGKVWKVEEVNNNGNTANELFFSNPNPEVGNPINNRSYKFNDRPIWFEEGVILKGSNNGNSPISILEFDVVPASTTTGGSGGGVSADGLIFNQVINYSENAAAFQANGSATWTDTIVIPEGKVWKIMSFSVVGLSSLDNHISDCDGCTAELGNLVAYSRYISGYSPPTNQYPMFINEGAKELKVYNGSNSFNLKVSFTAVEYNIP